MADVTNEGSEGNFWTNMTERERRLVLGLLANFVVLGSFLGVYSLQQALTGIEDEIAGYKKALTTMAQFGPDYIARKNAEKVDDGNASKFTEEVMKDNDLKLTSFVAEHASAVDLKIDNYDEDVSPKSAGKDGEPIIDELALRVNVRQAEVKKVLQLLDRIESSPEPVVIKRINMRDIRNKEGFVRADLTVSTFVQKEPEG